MMLWEKALAPAKLNLFLHVVGRRADGYHLLETVFVLLDWGDVLYFEVRLDGVVCRMTEVAGVLPEQDLIIRAANLLKKHALEKQKKIGLGVNIRIEKNLPMGAGLGGGSSDAATTLMVLNHLWGLGLSRSELMGLGLQLGADVPFFIFGQTAFGRGIGEDLVPIYTPIRWYVIIFPNVSISTASIFTSPDLTRETNPVKISDFSGVCDDFGKNDLQTVAVRMFPELAKALDWLGQFGKAKMTGSGACVFCSFEEKEEAHAVLAKMPSCWHGWVAKSIPKHPLAEDVLVM